MLEENGIRDQPNPTLKQRSLLSKYEIPIDHLSYEYIRECKDIRELERIVRILSSGEEGYYPDLQKTAEERLRSLSPNNRLLRTEEPVLTKNSMNNEEWDNIMSNVSSWKKEISVRDLRLAEENNNTMEEISLPPVRQPPPSKCAPEKKAVEGTQSSTSRKGMSDYAAWDKYDADTELLKMDLQQERGKEERELDRREAETDRLEIIVKDAEKLSETERQVLAEQEKNRGNEFYQAKDFTEAIKYYTASIAIWPTAKAHNNRAACHLKLCKYSAALEDATKTLTLEQDNIKALFRRGIALQHKNMFREALEDINAVLRQQPKHLLAQHISRELREQILTLPRTVRIMTDEGMNKPKTVVQVSETELTRASLSATSYEVNEWGLPKVMCQCSGSPRFLQLAHHKCRPTAHFQPRATPVINNAKIIELPCEPELPKVTSTKLEIVEVEKSGASENFFKPKKCVVVDKRTHKNVLLNGDIGTNLAKNTNLSDGGPSTNLGSGDAEIDKDIELNSLLLDNSIKSVTKPSV